jgi:4-hydroxybenzoate polyprenyltransferase
MVARPAAITPARRLGYRLLGGGFDYLLHLRPAEWPIMAAHTAIGYGLAVGLGGVRAGEALGPAVLGLVVWVVLLNGGTLAINSAFDRDEGDIGYLVAPPTPPPQLGLVAFGLMLAGQGIATALPTGYQLAYLTCFVMSVAYSVPPLRLKAVAGADWLINMWGFGTLTPYAGFAATGRPLDLVSGLVLVAFCPLFAALYPLTQLYQFEEDRRRGDRTLALIVGLRLSLFIALGACLLAFGVLGWAAALSGWGAGWRWAVLALALGAWLWVLIPWLRGAESMTPTQHQRGMYAALGAWAVTDLAVLVAWGAPA